MSSVSRREFLHRGAGAAVGLGLFGACSPDGSTDATPDALDDLERRLAGRLLRPADDAYDAASAARNGRYVSVRPTAVAQVTGADDVVICVDWAREHGVDPVVRGGGHNYAGFSSTTGLLIDLGALNTVDFDPATGVAVVGGAATNADVFAATVDGSHILPGGTCPTVGIGGLTLGGGIGYNCRWAGLTSDHLVRTRIVTASGEVLDVDESADADLFWACRGAAGGSLGVNTSFTFQLPEVPAPRSVYFELRWSGAEAAGAMFQAYDQVCVDAPPAFNSVAMAQAIPLGEGAGAGDAVEVMIRGHHLGSADELRDLLGPVIAAAGDPREQIVEERDFWQIQRERVNEESSPHSWGDLSRYADAAMPTEIYESIAGLLVACPHRDDLANGSFWSLGWVGGDVMNRVGRADTAYVHRGMSTLLRPTCTWPNDAPDSVGEELLAWTDELVRLIGPHTPNESYQNFPNQRIDDWAEQYYAENWDRLVEVKRRHDPNDLFRNGQSIGLST